MTYKVLLDYGSEGMSFLGGHDGTEFISVDDAVKVAMEYYSSRKPIIVTIIDWEAKPKD